MKGVETIKTATRAILAAIWLHAKVRESGLELRPKLNGGPVCEAQCR